MGNLNKRAAAAAMLFAALLSSYRGLQAFMTSGVYRSLISEHVTTGNSDYKTGGSYSLLGSAGQPGYGALRSANYSLNWGVINSWRPAQGDVSLSHAYPNPCNSSKGCSTVTFTRLTLDATVRVYTISGELVRTIKKSSNIDSVGWDLRNESGRKVASGLYLYLSEGGGTKKTGKLVIVR